MKPLISVIVPTYRRTKTLYNTLISISKQNYSFVEIILIDDNADPAWNEKVNQIVSVICEKLPEGYTLQVIVNKTNHGAAQSRNIGIEFSKGFYITFLDDDDLYLPDKLSVQATAMNAASADYSLMDLNLYNNKNELAERKTHPYASGVSERDKLIRLHLMHHLTGTDTLMFRRDYLLQIGCFGTIDIGDEFYLMMKAIENGGNFLYIPKTLVHAAVHYDGSGLSSGPEKLQGEELLFRFKKQYFHKLKRQEIRYIRMRHHAVLAFAHLKNKNKRAFLIEALKSLAISPIDCGTMLYQRHRK